MEFEFCSMLIPHISSEVIMYVKIIKRQTKSKPPRSAVFRSFEYRHLFEEIYAGCSWVCGDEVERDCRRKWILQSVVSRRAGCRVVKSARHVLTINYYAVVDALRDVDANQYLEAYMGLPYPRSSLQRCFGTSDVNSPDVLKVRAAVAKVVAEIMAAYNAGEEAVVRAGNNAKRLELAGKIAAELKDIGERARRQQDAAFAKSAELLTVRDAAVELARKFFREAMKEYHPDLAKTDVERDIAHEQIVVLQELRAETLTQIKNVCQLPAPDCARTD